MKVGLSAESPRVSRNRLMAVFKPVSKSTNVSSCQSIERSFAVVFQQLDEYLVGLILKPQFHTVLAQLGGSQIELEYSEAADGSVLGRHNHLSSHKLSLV